MKVDCIVLGAGIVGTCVALHLQKAGRSTVLIDRRGISEETSFGNAGLIQREAVYPYGFPQDLRSLMRYATNTMVDMHFHPAALPGLAPFLFAYWRNSRPARHAEVARLYATLIAHCVTEHDALAAEADATHLLRRVGYIDLFRSASDRDASYAKADAWGREFGLNHLKLGPAELRQAEPHLSQDMVGALHWTDPVSVLDPHGLASAYLSRFETLGGRFIKGDASTLSERPGGGWTAVGFEGAIIEARDAVLCLGPWSDLVTRALGYRFPLGVKRGYHMHYKPVGNAVLNHVVVDSEFGYVLAPMNKGVRLTTGAEFARRDAAMTPVQLARAEPLAKGLLPLESRLDAEPWMGCRPCTPDMMPIIGPAHRHKNLTFAFGHAHHGLTLGAVTGRMVAEMVTGKEVFVNPEPFRPGRF
ncbi:MAG: FAD-binding oxidoreductase [Hyphomicrobiales bacterium]|jgi:D-amino-acid dehydrogenase|nr:FAD-binding oxidoreductase [Hyphomicrobiales bacterium]